MEEGEAAQGVDEFGGVFHKIINGVRRDTIIRIDGSCILNIIPCLILTHSNSILAIIIVNYESH